MIVLTRNEDPIKSPRTHFATATAYYESVAEKTSDTMTWESLRLYHTRESSNDLSIAKVARHTLAVELSGTIAHLSVMEGKTYDAPTHVNDICQLPAGLSARFAWQTIGSVQESLIVEFDSDMFVKHCPEFLSGQFLSGHLVPCNYQQNPELSYLVRLLSRELCESQRRGQLFADCLIRLFSIEIGQSAWTNRFLPVFSGGIADKKVRLVVDYIENHFASEISLADLTKVAGLSATQLIHSFKKQTGVTPYAHVVNRRVQHAILLLKKRDIPIAQIALEAGFSDQQQMTHVFRKRMGRTPGTFWGKA